MLFQVASLSLLLSVFNKPTSRLLHQYKPTPVAVSAFPTQAKSRAPQYVNADLPSQRRLGEKGGSKAGSVNSQAQFTARPTVGKKYGLKVGLGNQSSQLKSVIQTELAWTHVSIPGKVFYTTPTASGIDVIRQLDNFVTARIKNPPAFYKIFSGERKRMYGWELVNKGIRSEAEGGTGSCGTPGPSERSETSA